MGNLIDFIRAEEELDPLLRLRLKAGFVIPATWTKEENAVCLGLKKRCGGIVADNGSFLSFSARPQ